MPEALQEHLCELAIQIRCFKKKKKQVEWPIVFCRDFKSLCLKISCCIIIRSTFW